MNQNMACILAKKSSPALSKCTFLKNSFKKRKKSQRILSRINIIKHISKHISVYVKNVKNMETLKRAKGEEKVKGRPICLHGIKLKLEKNRIISLISTRK